MFRWIHKGASGAGQGARGHTPTARTLGIGAVLSLALHAAGALALLSTPRPRAVARADQSTLPILIVEADELPEAQPLVAPAATPTPVPAPRARSSPRRMRRLSAPVLPSPPAAEVGEVSDVTAVTDATAVTDVAEVAESPLPAAEPSALAPAALTAAPPVVVKRPIPAEPVQVGSGVAASLRVYDTFPSMPAPLRGPGAHHLVTVNICVSERGSVNRIQISAPAGTTALEHALREAISTWRYRPFMLQGAPVPFCHLLRLRYQLD